MNPEGTGRELDVVLDSVVEPATPPKLFAVLAPDPPLLYVASMSTVSIG